MDVLRKITPSVTVRGDEALTPHSTSLAFCCGLVRTRFFDPRRNRFHD